MSLWAADASVMVAALVAAHPQHEACARMLRHAQEARYAVVLAANGLAEVYQALCTLPLQPPISASAAAVLVRDGVEGRCRISGIHGDTLHDAIAAVVAAGRGGAAVHDALHVLSAQRARAECIWTLHVEDLLPYWDAEHVKHP
jgi:predicted nucleic acid-binding protein